MDADMKRDFIRRIILELLRKDNMHYTEVEKQVIASGHLFATSNTYKAQLHYLLENKYIRRVTRAISNNIKRPKLSRHLNILRRNRIQKNL